jgi:hypothetical protein
MTRDEIEEHVLTDAYGHWASDSGSHIRALESIADYLGVEFVDGRLSEIAFDASEVAADKMVDDFRERKACDVLPVGDRPDFCFWTPHRVLTVRDDEEAQS